MVNKKKNFAEPQKLAVVVHESENVIEIFVNALKKGLIFNETNSLDSVKTICTQVNLFFKLMFSF